MQASPITKDQWKKVLKALLYSVGAGFSGGLLLGVTGVIQGGSAKTSDVVTAGIIGGVVGALNGLAVTIKQVFTPAEQ